MLPTIILSEREGTARERVGEERGGGREGERQGGNEAGEGVCVEGRDGGAISARTDTITRIQYDPLTSGSM
jgi:hypothetical protein